MIVSHQLGLKVTSMTSLGNQLFAVDTGVLCLGNPLVFLLCFTAFNPR